MLGTAASSRTSSDGIPGRIGYKIRGGNLLQIQLGHHVFGDLPTFGGTILQAFETILHLGDPALEPGRQSFIGECRAHDRGDDLVQVGQPLDRVGEGLFIDLRILRPDPVADGAVGDGGELKTYTQLP